MLLALGFCLCVAASGCGTQDPQRGDAAGSASAPRDATGSFLEKLQECPAGDAAWRDALQWAQREKALETLETLARRLSTEHDDRWEPAWAVGECEFRSGREAQARIPYELALARARKARDLTGVACASNRLGWLAHQSGDLAHAGDLYDEALAASRAAGRDDLSAFVLNNVAGLKLQTGDLASAGRFLDEARAALTKLGRDDAALTCEYNRGVVLLELGNAVAAQAALEGFYTKCMERGEDERAARAAVTLGRLHLMLHQSDVARDWFARVPENAPNITARADLYLGKAMIREGRYAEATTLLGRARRNTDVQLIALLAETFAAEADLRRGVGAKARRSLERVREAADAGGAAAPQWLARRLLAKLALEENRTGAAIALLRESVAILERMAGGLDPENEGLRFLRERSEPYAELAAALAGAPGERENHDRVAQVLAVVEKAHARALRRFRSGPPEPLAPEVTLGRIEQGLQPGELLLDYLIGEDRGVVVAIRRGRVRAAPISGWRELRQPLMRYREHLARAPSDEAAGKPDARALQDGLRVGELVLGPVRDLIAGARRVYFVPDRELAILPPAAIPLVEESAAEPRARYLGERVETAILPMAGVPPSWKDSRLPMLLAGDPIGDRTGEFPAIRYAPRELSRIAGVWAPADVVQLIGEDFSRGALIAQPLDRFRTIHFATHAVASTQDPGRCAVIVSGGAKLGFDEIARLRLGSSLVVLSACRTGEGEVVPGEGVIGLSWSFLRAGARGIAASLWRAEDATTAKLMVAFHRGLKKGQDPVEAMVRAQREIVAERPHPGSWAPFVVVLRVEPGNSDEAKGP